MNLNDRVKQSSLWAAYGDAMGFMTELARTPVVKQRTGRNFIDSLTPWVRRVGGAFGVDLPLPRGTYSDDTQLRLATCRAIRSDGDFDVAAFASVELPVWTSYGLGAGHATKAGAEWLSRPGAKWCSNFFGDGKGRYVDAGGNGAAMRIQPHVWVTPLDAAKEIMLRDIVRNAITTHGHPRGFVGAAFHGLCLREAMFSGKAPNPDRLMEIARSLKSLHDVIRADRDLEAVWLPIWEQQSGGPISLAVEITSQELCQEITIALNGPIVSKEPTAQSYRCLVESLGCLSKENLGSATKTTVIAALLAHWCDGEPHKCAVLASNVLGSDTDTIATMACAIAGCTSSKSPPEELLDRKYIEYEASRLSEIREKGRAHSFKYPDLLFWKPPKRPLDCVGVRDGRWYLAGLGELKKSEVGSDPIRGGQSVWTWCELEFGQHVLVKHRASPHRLADEALPLFMQRKHGGKSRETLNEAPDTVAPKKETAAATSNHKASINAAADDVIRSGFDAKLVGQWLLRFADEPDGVDNAIAFAAIAAKARNARQRRDGSNGR